MRRGTETLSGMSTQIDKDVACCITYRDELSWPSGWLWVIAIPSPVPAQCHFIEQLQSPDSSRDVMTLRSHSSPSRNMILWKQLPHGKLDIWSLALTPILIYRLTLGKPCCGSSSVKREIEGIMSVSPSSRGHTGHIQKSLGSCKYCYPFFLFLAWESKGVKTGKLEIKFPLTPADLESCITPLLFLNPGFFS